MKQYKISRSHIVDIIIEGSEELNFSVEAHEIDDWVKSSEKTLHEFFWFDQLTAEHILYASEKIRQNIEERFFGRPSFHSLDLQEVMH